MRKRIIKELLKSKINSQTDLMAIKRKLAKKYGVKILKNADILRALDNVGAARNLPLRRILRKRAVRTLSGVAPVAVLTRAFSCPHKCAYCPTEKNVPKSYLSNEPAVMRAILCNYNPYKQVQLRLRALEINGHTPTKIELIVIGGTWSVLPEKYKYWHIKECFRGANDYRQKHKNTKTQKHTSIKALKQALSEEQRRNEKAKYKIIGLTLETRPDYIDGRELLEMRELGCTRVELGAQAVDDKILKKNKRGHGVKEIIKATKLLKNFSFKVTYHIMPGLPGSTPAKDLAMFKKLFFDARFQPDQIKFYPTIVTRGSLLYRWWMAGKYKSYTDRALRKLIVSCKKIVPQYARIIRLIRDIPGESIMAGNVITNLRQIMQNKGVKCECIRCREAGSKMVEVRSKKLEIIKYYASDGVEYFLQFTDKPGKALYGFCRLRLLSRGVERATHNVLPGAALVRELHVYGELVPVGSGRKVQHAGLGKKLMAEAEKIARKNGYEKIAVISGVGARGYYRKLGYKLKDSYMVKSLT